ncbi:MAG: head GIN domain-containing protein [Candidatus Dadabacteria bacterium]
MRVLFLLIAVSLTLSSCEFFGGERVYGSGHIVNQQRSIGSFNSVSAGGSMVIHIRQNPTSSVSIQADDNLMEYIDVYVDGSTLVVKPKYGYNLDPSRDITVYAAAPSFREIEVSGSGDVISDNQISGSGEMHMSVSGSGNIKVDVNLPKLTTEVSGSGTIAVKGAARDFNASISGSGDIRCFDLVTDNTSLDLSGAADAEVTANQKLDVEVSGSGDVKYKGNAAVNQHISGAGSVRKVG